MKLCRRLTPEERRYLKRACPDLAWVEDDDELATEFLRRIREEDLVLPMTEREQKLRSPPGRRGELPDAEEGETGEAAPERSVPDGEPPRT